MLDVEVCRNKRYLVTGASGFIGRALCRRLLDLGAAVHGTSRRPMNFPSTEWRHSSINLTDPEAVDNLFEECRPDCVIHLASCVTGRRELAWVRETFAGNLQTAVNVLVAAQRTGVSKTVLAGSLEEPGIGESVPLPASPYAASKWCASGYARMMHALYGLNVAVARIFMVYGPGQEDLQKLVPYVCLSALKRESPKLMSGSRPVDWIYLDDVADGLIRMTFAGPCDGSYVDLGSGKLVTTGHVAEVICDIVGTGISPDFGALPDRPREQVRRADHNLSRDLLEWSPTVDLQAGLARTVEWYRKLRLDTDDAEVMSV